MKSRFEIALKFVLSWEGGYENDPQDPGGETKYGINKRDHMDVDIKNLTVEQAGKIYFDKYWIPSGCDKLSAPLDLIVFDASVNCGVGTSIGWLKETNSEIDLLLARRVLYYFRVVKKTNTSKKYLKGWLNRVSDLASIVLVKG